MKKFFGKKVFIILAIILLLGGGAAAYLFVFKSRPSNNSASGPKITKVDTVFGYLGSESNYSKFNALVGMFDSAKYLAKNEAGLEPSLIVFAPSNSAFAKDDMKPFDALTVAAREQVKLYHMAVIYPADQTTKANLELTDGKLIKTLQGKELTVSIKNNTIFITDGKGRESTVSVNYAESPKGDRIYFLDSVLLFQ